MQIRSEIDRGKGSQFSHSFTSLSLIVDQAHLSGAAAAMILIDVTVNRFAKSIIMSLCAAYQSRVTGSSAEAVFPQYQSEP